jgi:hypothetical protein
MQFFRARFDYEHRFAEHEHVFWHRSRIAHASSIAAIEAA